MIKFVKKLISDKKTMSEREHGVADVKTEVKPEVKTEIDELISSVLTGLEAAENGPKEYIGIFQRLWPAITKIKVESL